MIEWLPVLYSCINMLFWKA